MLLSFADLVRKYNIKSDGLIHCGAHYGQEYDDYVAAGIKEIVFIEPCKETFDKLFERLGNKPYVYLVNCAVGDKTEARVMYTGSQNEGQSNSLLEMDKHLQIHEGITLTTTEMVGVVRLDDLIEKKEDFNFLVMDCQGYEGYILRGAPELLKNIDYVYTEANCDEVYKFCTRIEELDELLKDFTRVETGTWVGGMWTDVFYKRTNLL